MYYFKTVMQWVATVVIGSLISAYVYAKYLNEFVTTKGQFIDALFSFGGLAIIGSAIFSLPAFAIMLFVRYNNKKNDLNYTQSRNRILITHALACAATFGIMFYFDLRNGRQHLDELLILFSIVYPVIGHVIWYIGERTETHRIASSLIR